MSDGRISRIWPRLDSEPPVFFAEELAAGTRDALVGRGWLTEAARSGFAACPGCPEARVRRVEWYPDAVDGRLRGYVPCRECGPVEIDPETLRSWSLEVAAVLRDVWAAGGRGEPDDVLDGRLWLLGRATWAGRSREVWFARNALRATRPALTKELVRRPKAVVLVPTEDAVRGWAGTIANPVFALATLVTDAGTGVAFDAGAVEAAFAPSGSRVKPAPKRTKRAERTAAIEKLVAELTRHLRDARTYARTAGGTAGGPAFLPRPTQKELAGRTGLTESDVSRCLNDESARLLKLLWETANDEYRVLDYPHESSA